MQLSHLPTRAGMPLAMGLVFVSLFVIVSRKKALTQVIGFLMLENGIALLAVLGTHGIPLIVEIGVFLDVLMGFLVMQIFVYQIHETFESLDVEQLNRLRDDDPVSRPFVALLAPPLLAAAVAPVGRPYPPAVAGRTPCWRWSRWRRRCGWPRSWSRAPCRPGGRPRCSGWTPCPRCWRSAWPGCRRSRPSWGRASVTRPPRSAPLPPLREPLRLHDAGGGDHRQRRP